MSLTTINNALQTRRSLRFLVTGSVPFAWLMADQAIFALTNFVTNILFVRWLLPVDYGMFAVSFSGYLLLTVVHHGAVLEPLLVQSAQVDGGRRRSFIVTLIFAHLIWIAGISLTAVLGLAVAGALNMPNVGLAILGAGIGGSLMCTLLTARRLCLVFLSTRVSAMVGIIYMSGVVLTTYLIKQHGFVSWFDPWLIMGGWGLFCSTVISGLLLSSLRGENAYGLVELCKFQWKYARYGLVAALCSWGRVDGLLLILAQVAGLSTIAETRAVINLGNPLIQVVLALQASWLVAFSRDPGATRLRRSLILYCLAAGIVLVATASFYTPLVGLIYGGRYLTGAWLLPLFCLAHSLNGLELLFSCFLKGAGSLRRGYAPQVAGCIVSIVFGSWFIPSVGQIGFIYVVVASFATGSVIAFALAKARSFRSLLFSACMSMLRSEGDSL